MTAERKRLNCGCYESEEKRWTTHEANCEVMSKALTLHLGNCGWAKEFDTCPEWEIHVIKADWQVNGDRADSDEATPR